MYSTRLSWGALFEEEAKLPAIDGVAFVFGAAPDPEVPTELLGSATIVTANASQVTLEAHGVTKPHITFMRTNMGHHRRSDVVKAEVLRDRQTGLLILMSEEDDPECRRQLEFLAKINYRHDSLIIASAVQASMIHNSVLGSRRGFLLKRYRPSMGFRAITFCLRMGARSVAVGGVSFRSGGWSYTTYESNRIHLEGDGVIAARMVKRKLPVYAVDAAFATDTGLRRWSAEVDAEAVPERLSRSQPA